MNGIVLQPRAIEAEKSVLGAILGDATLIEKVINILHEKKIFYDIRHQAIWGHILKMKKEREVVDPVTLLSQINAKEKEEIGGAYYLSELIDSSIGPSQISRHAELVLKKWLQRKIISNSQKIMDVAYEDNTDLDDLIEQSHRYTTEIDSLRPGKGFNLDDALLSTADDILDTQSLINFGYTKLDNLAGGMTRGELTVVGGRPGHGKTTFVLNLLHNLLQKGLKVVLINREMPNTEILKKLIVLESGRLSYTDIRRGAKDEDTREAMFQAVDQIAHKYKDNLHMFDDIRDIPRAFAEIKRIKPDVVIDDYIQLISVEGIDKRRFQIEYIMNEYKWLAKTSKPKFTAILVSQLNRAIEKRGDAMPLLSDLSEGGTIEQTAECVLFCYYEYKVLHDQAPQGKFATKLIAAKVRYGETGTALFGFNGDKARFYNDKTEAVFG